MTVFWTGQTICFGIHSETGSIAAGHAVVAMIFLYSAFCESISREEVLNMTDDISQTMCAAHAYSDAKAC